MNSLNYKL